MKIYILKEYPVIGSIIGDMQIIGAVSRKSVANIWSESDNESETEKCIRSRQEIELDDPQILERIARM